MMLTKAVRQQIKPVLAAGGFKDKPAIRALICTLYLQGFDKFSKEDLIQLCTILHLEIMIETIEADPLGTGKPDLLGGV